MAVIAQRSATAWSAETIPLTGAAPNGKQAKGTVTLLVRPYADTTVNVLRAMNLRNADGLFGLSDPYAKLLGLSGQSQGWGQSKTIQVRLI